MELVVFYFLGFVIILISFIISLGFMVYKFKIIFEIYIS